MAEYIERKVVINRIKEYTLDVYDIDLDDAKQFGGNSLIENYCEGLYEATELVDDIPAADVAPVRHGQWIFGKDLPYSWGQILKNKYHLYCSECLEQAFNRSEDNDPDFDVDASYCPNCGANMALEEEK